jgi:hypothetical protein
MQDIVIDKVSLAVDDSPSLLRQMDSVFGGIDLELDSRSTDNGDRTLLDAWLKKMRARFWTMQDHFWSRTVIPGFDAGQLRAQVAGDALEVRGDGDILVRRIPLPDDVDRDTLSAMIHGRYFQVVGSRRDAPVERSAAATA